MNLSEQTLDLVIIGRSILSSHVNPTAQLYRGLINELSHYGHRTTYLEPLDRQARAPRDMFKSPYCEVWSYESIEVLLREYLPAIASADLVMLGSGVPGADRIAQWIANEARGIKLYYDTDLSRTLNSLDANSTCPLCLSPASVTAFNMYLSTTGGPALQRLCADYAVRNVRPLYESIDPFAFYRMDIEKTYDLGFIGTYKAERSTLLDDLLLKPAAMTPNRRFALAGEGYPADIVVPDNLTYLEHLPETNRVDFYNRQSCTLIIGQSNRRRFGYTPTVQLLAAAACGVPILSDAWTGLDEFFEHNRDIFCVHDHHEVLDVLYGTDEATKRKVGANARERVLSTHTTAQRARQLLAYWEEIAD
ncbi:CgeB family protein [Neolewinella litorea]|uniref:Glycosyltransferase n=1 Tax=Neolewinella litorea TaxID=2562452 RepID=A0A4S4NMX0_9BACT|nr:glycosyltransferase [Neolewinella litorea]THH41172.1 glycosyltransferase [Neolewinella litorea]